MLQARAMLAPLVLILFYDGAVPNASGRDQWTTGEAWAWNEKHGVIRGFNELGLGYPGMSREDVMRKASRLGYNSLRTGDYFRLWLQSPRDAKQRLRGTLDQAQANGLTVSPVMLWGFPAVTGGRNSLKDKSAKGWSDLRAYIQDMVGAFQTDDRITLWDVFNEPGNGDQEGTDLAVAKQLILWAREVNPCQPLTSSIMWTGPHPSPEQIAVEQLADVHNFHLYDCSANRMTNLEEMVRCLKSISDRPMVCTECLARPIGDTFGRILPGFSKYHVHWYNWGLYTCDANWSVSWHRSAFDPHEPWFHDVLHPDGDPYDWRDLELIRNFHFATPGEVPDPGVELTDRWLKERAWQWVFSGPLRGWTYRPSGITSWHALWQTNMTKLQVVEADLTWAQEKGCDGLRIRLDFAAWKAGTNQFCNRLEELLALADRHGMTVTPVLLTDSDAIHPVEDLTSYVRSLMGRFGRDGRIYCWDLFYQPCVTGLAPEKAEPLVRELFRAARFEFPGQPLTATPAVRVDKFDATFDFRRALAHQGGMGNHGWDKLHHLGASNASLCACIWSLSDLLSISSDQGAPETGWLLSIANRYGRPIICSEWSPAEAVDVENTLKVFSVQHVRWFSTGIPKTCADPAVRNGHEKISRLQNYGLLAPEVLLDNADLTRLVNQFRYSRVMTPKQ
jgi:hypothetical protein